MLTVVDLTSEFTESTTLPTVPHSVLIDILDGGTLPPAKLAEYARELKTLPRPIYIRCAQGHGRTALMAALLLITLGTERNQDDALQQIKQIRPRTAFDTAQRRGMNAAIVEI